MTALASGQANAAADEDARRAVIGAATAATAEALGKPVQLKAERLKLDGDWAFLYADMQDQHGRPISYAGTRLAEAAEHGAASRSLAALLRRVDERWTLVANAIGPTDVVWVDWPRDYGAPAALFED